MILILSLLFYRKYKVRKQIDESNKGGADVRQFEFLLRETKISAKTLSRQEINRSVFLSSQTI